ncbi:MAG: M20/M25/M40 family metallo-hydrolase [Mediterranea sp.]|jgi:hypothetical protein|nr:M20/M25/M40 family metallo-hydrolase [Mediterranea sp.]
MKPSFICAGLGLMVCLSTAAQTRQSDEMAYRIKQEAFGNQKIVELSQWFTDFLGPRLAESENGRRAEVLVKEKMTEFGLSNARQEYASGFPKGGWDNRKTYVAMTEPYYTAFAATPKAWSGSTQGFVKADVVYLDVNTEADLEKYRGKLSDKVVLLPVSQTYTLRFSPLASRLTEEELDELAQDPRPAPRRARYRGGDYTLRSAVARFLQTEKPLAVMAGDGTFNVPGSRSVNYKAGDPEPVPEITLPIEDHGRMARLIQMNVPVKMELEVSNTFSPADTIVNNVIAEIPGTDPKLKNEVVLIGAHLDSWHGGTGAADNASGCIVMMEAMRILKELGVQPRRTIRIALWGAEEHGLYGSRGYAGRFLYNRKDKKKEAGYDNFALYLNMDNGSGRFRGIYLEENDMAVPFFRTWMQPFETLGFTTLSLRRTGSTDHATFNALGLPAYQFIQDELEYGRTYHTLMDTYERLSIEDLRVNAALVAWFALNAAQDNARIPVKPGMP